MELLERAHVLTGLLTLIADATRRGGAAALLAGPAGIGKSSVVRAVLEALPSTTKVWAGRCDPLATPTPLGPLVDIAAADRRVRALLDRRDPITLGPGLVRLLGTPTVMVVEDIHWMDDATGDLLVHLTRRIEQTRSVVVVTHRDSPSGITPALHRFLDAVATGIAVHRTSLSPLSQSAVAHMAEGSGIDPVDLHRRTGGNPFFVTEVLAMPDRAVPPSIAASVVARTAGLSSDGRALVDLASIVPGGLVIDVARAVLGHEQAHRGIEDAAGKQMVLVEAGTIRFHHDLARTAVAEALPTSRRLDLHRDVLQELERHDEVPAARLAHHAHALGDPSRIRRYAPAAARVALERGAHRTAIMHLEAVLSLDVELEPDEHADVLELLAHAQFEVLPAGEHVEANLRAAQAWETAGRPARRACLLVRASAAHHRAGDVSASWRLLQRAMELAENLPMDAAVAEVQSEHLSRLMMLADLDRALVAAEELVPRLEGVDAPNALSDALVSRGITRILSGETDTGIADGWRAMEVARAGSPHLVAQHAMNMAECLLEAHGPGDAVAFVGRGIASAQERDQSALLCCCQALRARAHLQLGHLDRAAELARATARSDFRLAELTRTTVLGQCHTRTGHPDAARVLSTAADLLGDMDDLAFAGPLAAARAELAWLRDQPGAVAALTDVALQLARQRRHAWWVGELLHWRSLAGVPDPPPPDWVALPWGHMLAGRCKEAAACWQAHDSPYERATALSVGDVEAQREALGILTEIGAVPMGDLVRAALRESGAEGVPARPRTHGGELTDRQQEVLTLLAEGLTNAEIARRLRISPKTAGHHVSAILERLGVATRTEAAAMAIRHRLPPRA